MDMMVLMSLYKRPEHSLGIRKDGLDTRLFTLPHAMGLLRYEGVQLPTLTPVWLGMPRSQDLAIPGTLVIVTMTVGW